MATAIYIGLLLISQNFSDSLKANHPDFKEEESRIMDTICLFTMGFVLLFDILLLIKI